MTKGKINKDYAKLRKELALLIRLEVRAGFQSGTKHEGKNNADKDKPKVKTKNKAETESEDSVDILDIAVWNEFGTPHIPSRPFLRDSIDNNKSEIKVALQKLLVGFGDTKDTKTILQQIGALQVGFIQYTIDKGSFKENAPKTIKRKKSEKPLIETGQLRQSVNYVIEEAGKK